MRAKKNKKAFFSPLFFIWTGTYFFIYTFLLEVMIGTYYFLIPLAFLGLFLLVYSLEKRLLINGLLFNLFLLSLGILMLIVYLETRDQLLLFLLEIVVTGLTMLLFFGSYGLITFLYWNAMVVFKKESHSLSNLLTFLLAVGLTALLGFYSYFSLSLPLWGAALFSSVLLVIGYFFIVLYNFLTISILYQYNQPKYQQDYIIVLGSGLINGNQVPPLLGKRIEKAIQFYHEQLKQTSKAPLLLMSGGQGTDESLPESEAMKLFAIEKGIPEADILVETESRNTLENMTFSKKIMDQHSDNKEYQAIFSTNNYHLFRAGIFARMAHLKADGIGAKTAFYFLPNAFLREFIAIVMMKKRRHVIVSALIISGMIVLSYLLYRYM
ncbi:YdcF family protein [Enterococcus sp. 7F3_DIV0205]